MIGSEGIDRLRGAGGGNRGAGTAMTLDEALMISQHAEDGTLDLSVPRIAALVAEARRVHLSAELWGHPSDPSIRRYSKAVVAVSIVIVATSILGLIASFAFAH